MEKDKINGEEFVIKKLKLVETPSEHLGSTKKSEFKRWRIIKSFGMNVEGD